MGRLLHGGGGREGQIGGREGAEVEGSLSGFWPPAREAAPVGSGRWGKTGEWSCCVLRRRECVLWGSLLSKELEQPSLVEVALGFFFQRKGGLTESRIRGLERLQKAMGKRVRGSLVSLFFDKGCRGCAASRRVFHF